MAQTYRFRLLSGLHISDGPKDARGNTTDQIYRPGDIIETTENLLKYNGSGHRPKYEAVDHIPVPEPRPAPTVERQPPPNWIPPQVTPEGNIVHREEEIDVKHNVVVDAKTMQPQQHTHNKGGDRDYLSALEKMSLKELQAHAAEEEIDLRGASDKSAILKVIRATLSVAK